MISQTHSAVTAKQGDLHELKGASNVHLWAKHVHFTKQMWSECSRQFVLSSFMTEYAVVCGKKTNYNKAFLLTLKSDCGSCKMS